ncbi:uncharacterized protein TrAFT101_005710 [Trichoderma asperellum]|uniref:uncharacterized protein n=1 Tax=Trichoderma asperellum TaxID=101201 RepID=UPI00332465C6|nr:hypothetical protein TrAFT101_005710 [Trichoderma asperellum]
MHFIFPATAGGRVNDWTGEAELSDDRRPAILHDFLSEIVPLAGAARQKLVCGR